MRHLLLITCALWTFCHAEPEYPEATELYEDVMERQQTDQNNPEPDAISTKKSSSSSHKDVIPVRAFPAASSQITPSQDLASHTPESGQLSREQIGHVASTCQEAIHKMWEGHKQIPPSQQPAFQKAIGEAQRACRSVQALHKQFEKADEEIRIIDEQMLTARNLY